MTGRSPETTASDTRGGALVRYGFAALAWGRNVLAVAGAVMVALLVLGTRSPDVFPFYIDAHLLSRVLLYSVCLGTAVTVGVAQRLFVGPRRQPR